MLKRLVYVLALALLLAGCKSKEEKLGEAAFGYLEDYYHLTDMEISSIERIEPHGVPLSLYLLGYVLSGSDYKVEVKVNETVPVVVGGIVNDRELHYRNVDYVPKKHEALQKQNAQYEETMAELAEMGIVETDVFDEYIYEYYQENIRILRFKMEADNADLNSEQLVESLSMFKGHILEHIDSEMIIELALPVNEYRYSEFQTDAKEIIIAPDKEDTLIDKLIEQLNFAELANKANEAFKEEIEDLFDVALYSSYFENDFDPQSDDELFRHEMDIAILEGFEKDGMLELMDYLREQGFADSFLKFTFSEGKTGFCQVKEVRTMDDYDRCYLAIETSASLYEVD